MRYDEFVYTTITSPVGIVAASLAARAVGRVLASPFRYPYFVVRFDVSHKRNVDVRDYVDRYLADATNRRALRQHETLIGQWKAEQEAYLETCRLRKGRPRQYGEALDDAHVYRFETVRERTRYRQRNYVRTPYKVTVTDEVLAVDWTWITDRNARLAAIDYEPTLGDYHAKEQRRLMTPGLRRRIMERDGHTCHICGKRMPDWVGPHVDHVVPLAKGGKTAPSNLQVPFSMCNGGKGARVGGGPIAKILSASASKLGQAAGSPPLPESFWMGMYLHTGIGYSGANGLVCDGRDVAWESRSASRL